MSPQTPKLKMVDSIIEKAKLTPEQIEVLKVEGISVRDIGLAVFDSVINEETTDYMIDLLMRKVDLPFWLSWLPIRRILDGLLPQKLRDVFVMLLYKSD